jgi:two-component system alkaline phosphatase synthesis response regulator PhoP
VPKTPGNKPPKKILIADDEPHIAGLIETKLRLAGYQTIVAIDGVEALEKARIEKPNLVILDLTMPKMNGWEVCRLLKKDEATRRIPVFALTGRGEESAEIESKKSGVDHYITKPFSPSKLLSLIEETLSD